MVVLGYKLALAKYSKMNKVAAERMALDLMGRYALLEQGWSFKFDRARRRFGRCSHRTKTIQISGPLCELNNEEEVRDTILHEIAHGLAGAGHGHDIVWRRYCRLVGCRAERCYSGERVKSPAKVWRGTCPKCSRTIERYKRMTISCGKCSREFCPSLVFVWVRL